MLSKQRNKSNMKDIPKKTKASNITGKYIQKDSMQISISYKYYMLPLIFILCIIPFIVRIKGYNPNLSQYSWFPNNDSHWDFFLYYKQWTLIVITFFMAILIAVKAYLYKKSITFLPIMIPLTVYLTLCILSTTFSDYISYSLNGGFEQFESLFALLSYGIIVYYAILFVQTEKDIQYLLSFLMISVLLMAILGVFQYIGYDFFDSEAGRWLIIPSELRQNFNISFSFPKKMVYLTLYNPNYVGSYIALFIPLFFILLFFQKKKYIIPVQILIVIGLVISAIGSRSDSGIIAVITVMLLIPIFLWRSILKQWYFVLSSLMILFVALVFVDKQTDILSTFTSKYKIEKTEFNLTDLHTGDQYVSFKYMGNEIRVSYIITDDMTVTFNQVDEEGNPVEFAINATTGKYTSMDGRFPGIVLGADNSYNGVFYIMIDGEQWNFYWDSVEGTYYYVNQYGKIDKIIEAPASIFNGYESIATGRGYIWSRTIPMLKDYLVLGSGPDTFAMVFPQNDYMNLRLNNLNIGILSKPHNMYLQIAIQTGFLSLVAFLVFYVMYFISSFRLYIRGRFTSYYAQIGVAIYISTIAYMITGLANDSSITTAPIFWTLIGIGIAVNRKAKPYIMEERQRLKEANKR